MKKRRSEATGSIAALLLPVTALLMAIGAHAQAGPCDILKSTLAARIESTGVRGYSLEAVPARTSVPSGAKVIGTCEGGATKILYRRWGAAQAASEATSATKTATPVPRAAAAARELPAVPPREVAAPAMPAPAPIVDNVPSSRAGAPAAAASSPLPPVKPVEATPSWTRPALEVLTAHWPWIVALVVLLAAGIWIRAWHARRSYYDAAGLPRGPRL